MRRWKRLLLALCLVLGAAVGFVLCGSRHQLYADLEVSFVGYTNRLISITNPPAGFLAYSTNVTVAVLRATNSGPVALQICNASTYVTTGTNAYSYSQTPAALLAISAPTFPVPQVLQPGESLILEAVAPLEFGAWTTEVGFRRWGNWDRIHDRILTSANVTIQRWMERVFPSPKEFDVSVGPITNQPPAAFAANK